MQYDTSSAPHLVPLQLPLSYGIWGHSSLYFSLNQVNLLMSMPHCFALLSAQYSFSPLAAVWDETPTPSAVASARPPPSSRELPIASDCRRLRRPRHLPRWPEWTMEAAASQCASPTASLRSHYYSMCRNPASVSPCRTDSTAEVMEVPAAGTECRRRRPDPSSPS